MNSSFSGTLEGVDSGRGVRLSNSRHPSVQIATKRPLPQVIVAKWARGTYQCNGRGPCGPKTTPPSLSLV